MEAKEIYQKTEEYYGSKIKQFGANYAGVNWNGEKAQKIRYDQLAKLINMENKNFSVCDYGCGYGYFLSYLKERLPFWRGGYIGVDSSVTMIDTAKQLFGENNEKYKFCCDTGIVGVYDYVVASGIFNLSMGMSEKEFNTYMLKIIQTFHRSSKKGFAFNALTKYSDQDKMRKDLYYSDPLFWFDYCKKNFSKNVALLHDYELYDFTIIVRKIFE